MKIELIGVGISERGGQKWFLGRAAIREIIEGDWTYWGAVEIDVEGAKITVSGETVWFSTNRLPTLKKSRTLGFDFFGIDAIYSTLP